ncbi:hypothetical protein QTN25_004376 [Entamoeba marina]
MNNTQLDSYSMLIVSKYFETANDFINVMCVCKKFKETTEKLRYNPIPITSLKLFPKIQTQYLYTKNDTKIEKINEYQIWYEVDYEEYLKFKEVNIKCHHIKYKSSNRNLFDSIPESVTILNDVCFRNSLNFKSITIPNHITFIGESCFSKCYKLESVVLSKSLSKLSDYCFSNCNSLSTINIPQSIQSIGYYCFSGCRSLQSIELPNSVILLEEGVFNNCSTLTNVVLSTSLISIGKECFSNCSMLKTIELPTSLQFIGKNCFSSCGIESMKLPGSIITIGVDCFLNCTSLTNLNLQSTEKKFKFKVSYSDSILYNKFGILCSNITLTQNDATIKFNEMKQHNNDCEINFIVPNSVIEFDDNCFSGSFVKTNTITIPTNVTSIGEFCFCGTENVETINISTAIDSLPNCCFSYCNIKSLTIPTTVTSIGDCCFESCSLLTSLTIPSSVKKIGNNCFLECDELRELSLTLNNNNKYPFKTSYSDYLLLKQCGIDCENVIFEHVNYKNLKLIPLDIPLILNIKRITTETTIQNNIISIKSYYLSKDITSIIIPTNVTYLCNECFKDYTNLQSITIPTTVKYIGKHLIDGCISLTELNYDGDWNSIIVSYNDYIRYKFIGLLFNSIEYTKNDKEKYGNVIPLIVQSLNNSYYDRSSTILYIPTHITSLDNNMFQPIFYSYGDELDSKLQSIIIPTSIKTIPKYCFSKCHLLTKVSLPSTLTSIKKKAFEKCISLQSIIIPSSVISIEQYAFEGCYLLSRLVLSTKTIVLRQGCFKGCKLLQELLGVNDEYY